jgi:hypothetical protein
MNCCNNCLHLKRYNEIYPDSMHNKIIRICNLFYTEDGIHIIILNPNKSGPCRYYVNNYIQDLYEIYMEALNWILW